MNKLKLFVASLTAATMALGCGALVACNNGEEEGTTPPAQEQTPSTPTTPTTPGNDNYTKYTVTLNVGDGEYKTAGQATTFETDKDGKISGTLPVPVKENWRFVDWYTAAEGGDVIDEATTVFTQDTTIYAQYVRNDGLWDADGEAFKAAITRNNGATDIEQYWLGGSSVNLLEDAEVSIYLNGSLVNFYINQSSTCIDKTITSETVTSVTVTDDAKFVLYLNHNNDGTWTCEFTGTVLNMEIKTTVPNGCEAITITADNGTLTLYIVDAEDNGLNSENWEHYCLYSWNSALFGGWKDCLTQGLLSSEMDVTEKGDVTSSFGLQIRWETEDSKFADCNEYGDAGENSGNITGLEVGNTYIIKINGAGSNKVYLYVAE